MTEKNGNIEAARRIQDAMRKTKDIKELLDKEKAEELQRLLESNEKQRKQDQFGFLILIFFFFTVLFFTLVIKNYN